MSILWPLKILSLFNYFVDYFGWRNKTQTHHRMPVNIFDNKREILPQKIIIIRELYASEGLFYETYLSSKKKRRKNRMVL